MRAEQEVISSWPYEVRISDTSPPPPQGAHIDRLSTQYGQAPAVALGEWDWPREYGHYEIWDNLLKKSLVWVNALLWNIKSQFSRITMTFFDFVEQYMVYPHDEFPRNTKGWFNFGLMMAYRLLRWSNIIPTLDQCHVVGGLLVEKWLCLWVAFL